MLKRDFSRATGDKLWPCDGQWGLIYRGSLRASGSKSDVGTAENAAAAA